ncbi:MAG: hypothetical protein IT546_10535 [Caulobacteraceae bacterium]|nr:hypothetical protein [Caulobacteraceae bacterium]
MLFKMDTLAAVREGRVTLALRRWKRPSVKAGGRLLTPIGELAIETIEAIALADITEADAHAAGFADLAAARAAVATGEGEVHRIRFRLAGADPRIALRLDAENDLSEPVETLARLDAGPRGAWTRPVLELIAAHIATRAGDLAPRLGWDTPTFKTHVRKLKALGLTESLEIGYRLSPRGEAVLARLAAGAGEG